MLSCPLANNTQQADSVFGRALDLPSLGVNIPSGDKLQDFLAKGKKRVQDAKNKALELKKNVNAKKSEEQPALEDGTEGDAVEADVVSSDAEKRGDGGGDGKNDATPSSSLRIPYFETTFVDDDLRVGRTGQGDLYVSTRV